MVRCIGLLDWEINVFFFCLIMQLWNHIFSAHFRSLVLFVTYANLSDIFGFLPFWELTKGYLFIHFDFEKLLKNWGKMSSFRNYSFFFFPCYFCLV